MKHLLCSIALLFTSLCASAQGVAIYGTDGTRIDIPKSQISSIEFYEKTVLPLSQPEDVEAVDLGLSVRWASCNVGAQKTEDPGAYFAWGEVAEKEDYSWATYFDADCNTATPGICGNASYDAAAAAWGGQWRLPSLAEMQELCDRCTWTWTDQDGQHGCLVTGPSGASIFIPAGGTRQGSSLYLQGIYGSLLTGTLDADNRFYERSLVFYSTSEHWIDTNLRDYGQNIRPVCK